MPWVIVGIVIAVEISTITLVLTSRGRRKMQGEKSPREARAASQRVTNNVLIPLLSSLSVGASLIGGAVFPDFGSEIREGQVELVIIVFMFVMAVQALSAWVAASEVPQIDSFYSCPERIYLALSEIDLLASDARRQHSRIEACYKDWQQAFGKRVFGVGYAKRCDRLNRSLSWVPVSEEASFRELFNFPKLFMVVMVSNTTGLVGWFFGFMVLTSLLLAGLLGYMVWLTNPHLLPLWLVLCVFVVIIWVFMESLLAVKSVRWLARQRSFEAKLPDRFSEIDRRISEVETRRQREVERRQVQLDSIQQSLERLEKSPVRGKCIRWFSSSRNCKR